MNSTFGPWATAMHSGQHATLSSFWKERMSRLAAITPAPAAVSRQSALLLWVIAVFAGAMPTLHGVAAPRENAADVQPQHSGRLFVSGWIRATAPGETEPQDLRGIFSIDPETGEWKRLLESGHGARVSPDGETLIFSRDDETWNCDAKEAAGPGKIANVSGKTSWTADGKHFVVSPGEFDEMNPDKGWRTQTWKISADGLTRTELAIPATDSVEDCSPTGDLVVTCSDRHPPHGSGYQLYVMQSNGGDQRRITQDGLNCDARFSPDGKRIAYLHQDKNGNSLRIVDVNGANEQTILRENGHSNSTRSAAWSADGKRLAVIRYDWQTDENGERVIRDPSDARHRIELMDADGGNPSELALKDAEIVWLGDLDWR